MSDSEQMGKDFAEAAKQRVLRAVNAEESWIERHPGLTGWIITGFLVVCIIMAIKGCT